MTSSAVSRRRNSFSQSASILAAVEQIAAAIGALDARLDPVAQRLLHHLVRVVRVSCTQSLNEARKPCTTPCSSWPISFNSFVQQLASRILADGRALRREQLFAFGVRRAARARSRQVARAERNAMIAPQRLHAIFRDSPTSGLKIKLIEPRRPHGVVAQGREDERFEQPRVRAGRSPQQPP